MNAAYFSAFAALAGSAIGGLTMLASSWLSQNTQTRAEQLAHNKARREELYKDFIEEAVQLYIDALGHNQAEVAKFVKLYALIGRMRVLSSPKVVEAAESVASTIIETYQAPNKTFRDIRGIVNSDAMDPFLALSEACRDELQSSSPLF
jgi:hypothetical protein